MLTTQIQKTIENRNLDDIIKENRELIAKLKQNSIAMHIMKINEKHEKDKKKLEELLIKPRKNFAFHVIEQEKTDLSIIKNYIEKIWEKTGKNITKFIMLNNFIYIKSKENIIISDTHLGITDKCYLEQVNPKDIIKLQ